MDNLFSSQRKWQLIGIDIIAVVSSYFLSIFIRSNIDIPIFRDVIGSNTMFGFESIWVPVALISCLFIISQYLLGVYDDWNTSDFLKWLFKLAVPNMISGIAILALMYSLRNYSFPRSIVFVFVFVNTWLSAAWRSVYYLRLSNRRVRIAVFADSLDKASSLIKKLKRHPFSQQLSLVQAYSSCGESGVVDGVKVESLDHFTYIAGDSDYSAAILSLETGRSATKTLEIVKEIPASIQLYYVPTIHEVLLGAIGDMKMGDLPLVRIRLYRESQAHDSVKRVFDIGLSLLLLLISIIPMVLVGVLVKLTSPGAIFYIQERVGKNGELFDMFKFRSMYVGAESKTGPVLATKMDRRITTFGRFLRKTRIDELPQLVNILKGEMSFVGPRPERPVFVNKFNRSIECYGERSRVRPGVTGLAQVNANYETPAEIKLKYDLAYLSSRSLALDLKILFKTLKVVLSKSGQ